MSGTDSHYFSNKLRNIFWPIHNFELYKFIPMSLLMFCVLFNQNILRILKDSIVISEVSAEVTSFAKLYCVTPVAGLFVILYAKLINHLPLHKIFSYIILVFVAFYIIFAFIIYPNADLFHMNPTTLASLMLEYPHLKWYIALVGNWSYILFYTFSELWPNIFYVLLFWQIANEVTSTNEAKRFYTLFSLFGNSALLVVGMIMSNLSSDTNFVYQAFSHIDSKILFTQLSIIMVVISAILSCFIVQYIAKHIMSDPDSLSAKASKPEMNLSDSFKYIVRSKYLWLMLICTASFGLSMNLIEALWKSKINELYPTVNEYAAFNSMYIFWTGIVIMIMTIIGNNVMRYKGWFASAIISPLIILITGTLFFILVVFDNQVILWSDGLILVSPLVMAVFVGAVQNILSKGSKYSTWDTSRQMLYIPLNAELRTKGKAAVDVVSPKMGKSLSGFVQSFIFVIFPMATYHSIAPILMVVFIVVCIFWIYAVRKIYHAYQALLANVGAT